MANLKQRSQGAPSWLRFSLFELSLLVALIAVLLAVLIRPQRQRLAVDEIRRLGGRVTYFAGDDVTTRLEPVEPSWLRTLVGELSVRVSEVDLSGGLDSDADLEVLATLKDVRVLRLDGTQITDAALAHLVGLTQLEEVNLKGTHITDEGVAALSGLSSLHTLNLANTRVTEEALVSLRRMPKLEHVTMLGLNLNGQDLADPDAVNRKLRILNRSDVVSDARLLSEIIEAWDERQDSVRSFAVTCAGTQTVRGTAFQIVLDVVVDSQGRSRASYAGKDVVGKAPVRLIDHDQTEVFDGKCAITLYAKQVGMDYPSAFVSREAIDWCNTLHYLPVAIAYRPLQRPGGGVIAKRGLALSRDVTTIDGEECIGLYHAGGMVWVCRSRGYLPMRYAKIRQGITTLDVHLSYARDGEHAWVLSAWKTSLFGPDGTCLYRYEASVGQCRVNEPIADATFEIAYPPGTLVSDRVSNEEYVLVGDGTRISVTPGEHEKAVRELLGSKPEGHPPAMSD